MLTLLLILFLSVTAYGEENVYCEGWPESDKNHTIRKITGTILSHKGNKILIKGSVENFPEEDGFYLLKLSQCVVETTDAKLIEVKVANSASTDSKSEPSNRVSDPVKPVSETVTATENTNHQGSNPGIKTAPVIADDSTVEPIDIQRPLMTSRQDRRPNLTPSEYSEKINPAKLMISSTLLLIVLLFLMYLLNRKK
jgi:hypothetical protein